MTVVLLVLRFILRSEGFRFTSRCMIAGDDRCMRIHWTSIVLCVRLKNRVARRRRWRLVLSRVQDTTGYRGNLGPLVSVVNSGRLWTSWFVFDRNGVVVSWCCRPRMRRIAVTAFVRSMEVWFFNARYLWWRCLWDSFCWAFFGRCQCRRYSGGELPCL